MKHCSRRIYDGLVEQNEETTKITTKLDMVSEREIGLTFFPQLILVVECLTQIYGLTSLL
jgi:hypothetical protein